MSFLFEAVERSSWSLTVVPFGAGGLHRFGLLSLNFRQGMGNKFRSMLRASPSGLDFSFRKEETSTVCTKLFKVFFLESKRYAVKETIQHLPFNSMQRILYFSMLCFLRSFTIWYFLQHQEIGAPCGLRPSTTTSDVQSALIYPINSRYLISIKLLVCLCHSLQVPGQSFHNCPVFWSRICIKARYFQACELVNGKVNVWSYEL